MIHIRQLIRKQIVDQLMGLELTGPRVYDSRVFAMDETEIPSLNVHAQAEAIELSNLAAPRDIDRSATFIITAVVKADTHYADMLDTICLNVEAALSTDLTLNGLVKDITLESLTFEFDEGEQLLGKMEMTYQVSYRTKENNAEVST